MKAMILAAGRGERLRPLTDTLPKPLLEVRGKALIVHHLVALAAAGFEAVVINLSWLGEQIREHLGDGRRFGLKIEYSEEAEALETAGGILQALDLLGERFIVVNADIVTDFDFSRLRHRQSQAHLVLVENPPHNPAGDFSLDGDLVGNQQDKRFTFSGISMFDRHFFDGLEQGSRPLAPLLRAAADRQQLSGEIYAGNWADIGTLERLNSLSSV